MPSGTAVRAGWAEPQPGSLSGRAVQRWNAPEQERRPDVDPPVRSSEALAQPPDGSAAPPVVEQPHRMRMGVTDVDLAHRVGSVRARDSIAEVHVDVVVPDGLARARVDQSMTLALDRCSEGRGTAGQGRRRLALQVRVPALYRRACARAGRRLPMVSRAGAEQVPERRHDQEREQRARADPDEWSSPRRTHDVGHQWRIFSR